MMIRRNARRLGWRRADPSRFAAATIPGHTIHDMATESFGMIDPRLEVAAASDSYSRAIAAMIIM